METTKSQVRSDFKYARELMRQADAAMRSYRPVPGENDYEDMRAIANELIACVATFEQWVEEAQDAAEAAEEEREETETPNPYAVQIPQGAWDQDEWNMWTR